MSDRNHPALAPLCHRCQRPFLAPASGTADLLLAAIRRRFERRLIDLSSARGLLRAMSHRPKLHLAETCDHFFDTTSRYDAERKLLTFFLFCPTCEVQQVVETLPYEPVFWRAGRAPIQAGVG